MRHVSSPIATASRTRSRPPHELEERQPVPLGVVPDAEHARAKGRLGVVARLREARKAVQQRLHTLVQQRRSAIAGEEPLLPNLASGRRLHSLPGEPARKVRLQQIVLALGDGLVQRLYGLNVRRELALRLPQHALGVLRRRGPSC